MSGDANTCTLCKRPCTPCPTCGNATWCEVCQWCVLAGSGLGHGPVEEPPQKPPVAVVDLGDINAMIGAFDALAGREGGTTSDSEGRRPPGLLVNVHVDVDAHADVDVVARIADGIRDELHRALNSVPEGGA